MSHAVTLDRAPNPLLDIAKLYAEGREEETSAQLRRHLSAAEDAASYDSMLMALDLERLRGDKPAFEALGEDYTERFAKPAPEWDPLVDENRLLPDLRLGGEACVQLCGDLDATQTIALNTGDALCRHAVVRMDGSCLRSLDKQACCVLLDTVTRLIDGGGGMHLTGVGRLTHCVHQLIEQDIRFRPGWDLLLKLWQIKGEEREFYRIGMEYSVGFGTGRPQWEPIVAPVVGIPQVEEKRGEPRYASGPEVMRMVGVVAGTQSFYLLELQNFAFDRTYVNVDLALLRRLDSCAARTFVDHINALISDGKTVRLLRMHSLIRALIGPYELSASVVCTPLTR